MLSSPSLVLPSNNSTRVTFFCRKFPGLASARRTAGPAAKLCPSLGAKMERWGVRAAIMNAGCDELGAMASDSPETLSHILMGPVSRPPAPAPCSESHNLQTPLEELASLMLL